LLYRKDMLTHRVDSKSAKGVNVLFGDGHVRFQNDPSFFTTGASGIWNSTANGQSIDNGGLEDRGNNFRWLIQAFHP